MTLTIMAIKKYKIDKHDQFPHYYPWWVMRSIQTKLPFMANPLFYFPIHMKEKLNKIYEVVKEHDCYDCERNHLCPKLTLEVRDFLNCSIGDAENFLLHYQSVESLDNVLLNNPILFSDNGSLIESVLESHYKKVSKKTIDSLFDVLSVREKKVLQLRFGFENGAEHTLEQIGTFLGVTRERIRQIESRALKKIKHPTRIKYLRAYWNEMI